MSANEDDENAIVCFMCDKVEANPQKNTIECTCCGRAVHFKCKKLRGNAIQRAKKLPFFCSNDCFDRHSRINQKDTENDQIIKEMRALGQVVRESRQESATMRIAFEKTQLQMQMQIGQLIESNKQIEASQEFLAEKFEMLNNGLKEFQTEMTSLKTENLELKQEMLSYKQQNGLLSNRLDSLEMELDNLHRKSLSKNVILLGVPMIENENVLQIVHSIADKVECTLGEGEIVTARRLNGPKSSTRSAPILAVF